MYWPVCLSCIPFWSVVSLSCSDIVSIGDFYAEVVTIDLLKFPILDIELTVD